MGWLDFAYGLDMVMLDKKNYHWKLAKQIINGWWKPLNEDGVSDAELEVAEARLGIRLPEAVREWYLMAGKRTDLINVQDHILSPNVLRIEEGSFLVFCLENQNVVQYGISLSTISLADPPVLVTAGNFATDAKEAGSFSRIILNMLAWATMMFRPSKYRVTTIPNNIAINLIEENFEFLGFDRGLPENETKFYCNEDGIVWLAEDWIDFSASNSASFEKVMKLFADTNLQWKPYQN